MNPRTTSLLPIPLPVLLLLALDFVPVHQLDRRRHHPDKGRAFDRLEALAAAGVTSYLWRPNSIACRRRFPGTCRNGPPSGPPRHVSPSSSLMPMTPLPTPARMLISSMGKWMTCPLADAR